MAWMSHGSPPETRPFRYQYNRRRALRCITGPPEKIRDGCWSRRRFPRCLCWIAPIDATTVARRHGGPARWKPAWWKDDADGHDARRRAGVRHLHCLLCGAHDRPAGAEETRWPCLPALHRRAGLHDLSDAPAGLPHLVLRLAAIRLDQRQPATRPV